MVQMALTALSEQNIVKLDEDKKATMVNNLMVALVSETSTQPLLIQEPLSIEQPLMRRLSDYMGKELLIFQKSIWRRDFELRSGEELIARLFYPKFFSDFTEISVWEETYEFLTDRSSSVAM